MPRPYVFRSIAALLVLLGVAAPLAPPAGAQQAQAQAQTPSRFDTVRSRIDPGGPFMVIVDYEDQIATLGRDLTAAVAAAVGDDPDLAPLRQDFAAIFEELGLSGIKAIGMSSSRVPGGGFFNRSFVHAPEPRRGLLAVLGGPARPFSTTRMAPPDSDFFVETEFDLAALVQTLIAIARRFEPAAGLDMAAEALAAETSREAGEALRLAASLRGRLTLVLSLGDTAAPHAQALEDWGIDFARKANYLLRMEGIGQPVARLLRKVPLLATASIAGRPAFRPAEAIPILGPNQPVVVIDGDALLLGSSAAFVTQSLAGGDGLGGSPVFAKAFGELGLAQGNTLTYATPRLHRVLRGLIAAGMQAASEAGEGHEMLPLAEAIIRQAPEPAAPVVSVSANLPDGILTHGRDTVSLRGALLALALYNPEIVGPIVLAVIPAAIKAEADRRGEARAAEIAEANLRLIGEAALAWFEANPGATQVGYAELAPGLAGRLGRVRDVDFTDFQLDRGFGKIELELPNGEVVVWHAPIGEAERERIRANLRRMDRAAAWYFRNNPRETVMLGTEAVEDGSPLSELPATVRGERYDELQIRRSDTEIAIDAGNETIVIPRDPALLRQQQPPRRQQPRGG